MSTSLHTNVAAKLPILVESDFDQFLLLSLISREPDEPLYRTVYKALYAEETIRVDAPPLEQSAPPQVSQ